MSKQLLTGARPLAAAVGVVGALVAVLAIFTAGATARTNEMPTPRQGPTITGTPIEGQTLTANNGQWLYSDGLGCGAECVYSYQWQRCNAAASVCAENIPGATSRFYAITAADVGLKLRVVNTLTKHDCDFRGNECRDVSSNQASAPTELVKAKAGPAPTVAELPKITGVPMEEETLTASTGLWNGEQPISMLWQWYRCDKAGGACGPIGGANAQTYKLAAADVGFTVRVTGTATNRNGSNFATSEATAVIQALGPTATRKSLTVDRVSLPNRLLIDKVTFTPTVLRSRTPFVARIHVSDTRGFRIEGALVQVIGVPFGQIGTVAEVETNQDGWAIFRLQPTKRLQLKAGGSLVLFLRARKPGDNPLAGVSTRRLVQVKTAAAPVAP